MSEETAKSGTIAVVRSAVAVAQAVVPIPRILLWLATAVIAAIVVALDRINVGAILREWARNATPGPDPVEHPPMPPIDMPEGGIPIPAKEWKDGEP